MIDPTREEWLAALKRANGARRVSVAPTHSIVEAALGCPCPPEPAPEPFYKGQHMLVTELGPGKIAVTRHILTPDEAVAMAAALIEHARYAREQEPEPPRPAPVAGPLIPAPVCGRMLDRKPSETSAMVCQHPKGHAGVCKVSA